MYQKSAEMFCHQTYLHNRQEMESVCHHRPPVDIHIRKYRFFLEHKLLKTVRTIIKIYIEVKYK